jgi:soluble lytic murein transglycosylase-like protein
MKTIRTCRDGETNTGPSVLLLVRFALIGLVFVLLGFAPACARSPRDIPPEGSAQSDPFDLAARYENGESVSRDYRRARLLYCDAAAKSDPRAQLALAWLFMNGRGVPRDDQAAVFWLHKAAAAHVPQAVTLLGMLGNITPIDRGCAAEGRAAIALREGTADGSALPKEPAASREAIEQAAADAGITPNLLSSMVSVESGYDTTAVSPKGAAGLMQLMPATAERFHVQNVFDYRENLRGGATYIRVLLDKFGGNLDLALAAYNAGEGAVDAHHGIPPYAETQAYIAMITRLCSCSDAVVVSPLVLVQSDKVPP